MKNTSLLMFSGLFLSSVTWASEWSTENQSWSTQSTEKQFEHKSGMIYKASKDEQANTMSVIPSAQSKTAISTNNKKDALA